MDMTIPTGFHVTADEMRQAGIRVHENIADHTTFTPPHFAALQERVAIAKRALHAEEADGKCADLDGDPELAERCRDRHDEIAAVLEIWRARWRDCRDEERRLSRAEYAMESDGEMAWLRHSERPDPEAQADLELHDALEGR